ncbi:15811_t:CDS:1, partial [Rhizophagus irregularis]
QVELLSIGYQSGICLIDTDYSYLRNNGSLTAICENNGPPNSFFDC